jgi:hypothetical protein
MNGNEIPLYHADGGLTVGRLLPRVMSFESGSGRGLKLTYDFVSGKQAPVGQWLTFDVSVTEATQSGFTRGRVDINPRQRPNLNPPTDSGLEFLWVLESAEIEELERVRSPGHPLRVRVYAQGLLKTEGNILEVRGDGSIEVPVSEWAGLLETYGYRVPPSVADLLSSFTTGGEAWTGAIDRLEPARRHVHKGETYAALAACLGEFEKLVQKPYVASSWTPRLGAVPDQKRDGLAGLLSGLCTYLNKVGHHKDLLPDETGDHPAMPVDFWECEVAVASSHLLLALAIRLAAEADQVAASSASS